VEKEGQVDALHDQDEPIWNEKISFDEQQIESILRTRDSLSSRRHLRGSEPSSTLGKLPSEVHALFYIGGHAAFHPPPFSPPEALLTYPPTSAGITSALSLISYLRNERKMCLILRLNGD
jgi:hypothetical protein